MLASHSNCLLSDVYNVSSLGENEWVWRFWGDSTDYRYESFSSEKAGEDQKARAGERMLENRVSSYWQNTRCVNSFPRSCMIHWSTFHLTVAWRAHFQYKQTLQRWKIKYPLKFTGSKRWGIKRLDDWFMVPA